MKTKRCRYLHKKCGSTRVYETIIAGYKNDIPQGDGKLHYHCSKCDKNISLNELRFIYR